MTYKNKLLVLSIIMLSTFMICKLKKKNQEQLKIKIDRINYNINRYYNSFLQPSERYIYLYTGTKYLLKKTLEKHFIEYIVSINNNIYICNSSKLEFEIRLDDDILEFILVVGTRKDLITLIDNIKKID